MTHIRLSNKTVGGFVLAPVSLVPNFALSKLRLDLDILRTIRTRGLTSAAQRPHYCEGETNKPHGKVKIKQV